MGNYFVSKEGKHQRYIFPEVNVLHNNFKDMAIAKRVAHPLDMDAARMADKINPYIVRISHPIALEAFVWRSTEVFYKVTEGYYCLEDGTLRLKVKKKYGK